MDPRRIKTSTYGPDLVLKRAISFAEYQEMCDEISDALQCEVKPENRGSEDEGGMVWTRQTAQYYKCLRVLGHANWKTQVEWSGENCSYAAVNARENYASDVVLFPPGEYATYLKAHDDAQCWTPSELKKVCRVFMAHGARTKNWQDIHYMRE